MFSGHRGYATRQVVLNRIPPLDTTEGIVGTGRKILGLSSLFLAAYLAILVIFAYYRVFLYPRYFSPLKHLPGPKDDVFLFGQCHMLLRATWVPHLFQEWSRRWPSSPFIRYLGVANSECLVVNSVAAYRDILQTQNHCFAKPALTRRCASMIIGDGLPFAEGSLHRRRRAVLARGFNTSQVKSMVPAMQDKARQLVNILGQDRCFVDDVKVQPHLWKTTLDIITMDVLGVDLDHLGSGNSSPLHELFERTMKQSAVGHVIHYLSSHLPLRSLIPLQLNRDFSRSCADARTYLRGHLNARKLATGEKCVQGVTLPQDMLQSMIDQDDQWSDDEIVEYLLNLIVLGHDTTACTLVWAGHVLSEHQEHQYRLRKEIASIGPCPRLTYDEIERLPFLENFLREVLRLYCPVTYVPREATEKVEVDGVVLPKGTVVNLCPAVMNTHPLVWGEDAAEFNPSRWESPTTVSGGAYAFESFHHGPRVCLGKQLAMMEMKVILVELVSRFHMTAADPAKVIAFASPSFTLRPLEALSVRLDDVDTAGAIISDHEDRA